MHSLKNLTYRKYLLTLLLVIQAFNYLDGLALGLVLQNIKADLHLSDTQLGFLSGIAFWLFYSAMGIPIARWADRGNRVTIISLAVALWSVMVALCGLAQSFLQLLSIRICVAVGEAGCIPPAHSLLADYFTRAERPRAVAIYMLGGPLSMALGYFFAGWLNESYGWRATFVMLGLPGLVLSLAARLTLREPRRARVGKAAHATLELHPNRRKPVETTPAAQPSLRVVCITLWSKPTFRHLLIYFSVASFFVSGILQWQPAFFVRSYGMQTGELGTWFAIIYGIGGIIGSYCCGDLASRRAAQQEKLQLRWMATVICCLGLVSALIYIAPNHYLAFCMMGLAAIGGAATNGPVFATIQTLVPEHMRAISIALIYLSANLIGTGLGPLAAGFLSDTFRPWAGEDSLRYALLALCPGYLWAAWHLWRAGVTVARDLETAQSSAGTADEATNIALNARGGVV